MPFPCSCATIGALLALTSLLPAETSTVVTLSNVHSLVRSKNPELATARIRIREAVGRATQSTRLPNPELETSFEQNPSSGEGRLEMGISRKFPVTDRLRLAKELSATSIRAAEIEVGETERLITSEARKRVIELLASKEQRTLLRQQQALTAEFATKLRNAATKGEGSALDAGQAELDGIRLTLALRKLETEESQLLANLKPLIGLKADETISVSGTLPPAKIPSVAPDPAKRPDYQIARLNEEQAAAQAALERAERFDDVEGGLFVAGERSKDAPLGSDTDAIIGLRFRVALPFWNKNEGAIAEADALHERRRLESARLADAILLEADAAREEMGMRAETIREILGRMLPAAEAQTKAAEKAFRNGQTGIDNLLRARSESLELRATAVEALRDFHLARIRYQTAIGGPEL